MGNIVFKETFETPAEHSKGTNTCEFVILHHTGTSEKTINGVLGGLNKREDYASCHFAIDEDGNIYKMGKETDILWHAGISLWNGTKDLNKFSIGIEIIGPLKNGGFTDAQRKSVKELVQYLCAKFYIPEKNVLRHKDIAPKRKVDVADTLWNGSFKTFEEYRSSLFVNSSTMKKTKYTDLKDAALKDSGMQAIFENYTGDNSLTEQETKELIEIAFARFFKRLTLKYTIQVK